jgi:hypothetical protein
MVADVIGAVALVSLLTNWSLLAAEGVATPTMVGHWEGTARIIVTWCQQTNLPVKLDIRADGKVAGTVGDATLARARLERNRGWLGRKLNIKTDYIITGDLKGAIVAAEGIERSGVKMPLNFTCGTFVGGIHTSGWLGGGKEGMILSASSLVLRRTNNPR